MKEWAKKNKDLLIAILGILTFIILLTLFGLFFKGGKKEQSNTPPPPNHVEKVDMTMEKFDEESQKPAPQTSSFFLKPSPTELLEKLSQLDSHQLKAEAKKLPGLRILWPTYFFSVTHQELGTATLLLDTLENGFGPTIVCTVNSSKFPQVLTMEPGTKFWVAGEVVAINPEGVGQIKINTEHLRFSEQGNWTPNEESVRK